MAAPQEGRMTIHKEHANLRAPSEGPYYQNVGLTPLGFAIIKTWD
ncbi:MAG: hypothetical protein QOF48_874 [Verrucomicrobiota bacterium]|jgi:hypothetical protein